MTEQLKQKEYCLYNHSSVTSARTLSKMKPQVPSISSNQMSDDLYDFLGNHSFRKKYNKVLNLAKKFRNVEAKIDFLKICIDEKKFLKYTKSMKLDQFHMSVQSSVAVGPLQKTYHCLLNITSNI